MQDERFLPIGAADPLRYIDARYEPHDPLFDADEPHDRFPRLLRKRRAAAVVAFIAGGISCGVPTVPALRATDSILVQLAEDASPPPGRSRPDSGPPIVSLAVVADGKAPLLRIPLQPGDDPEAIADSAARQPGVEFAEPVYLYRTSKTPDDARFKEQWGIAQVGAPEAWNQTTGSRDVTVAVIDDGITLDHPDLAPNLWTNPGEIAGNGVDDDDDGITDDVHGASFLEGAVTGDPSPATANEAPYHGSHVAGIIGAAGGNQIGIAGVNWKVSLMGLRALGPSGGRSDDLAMAIDYAADHGARIVNAAWGGGGESHVLAQAIERAAGRGVMVVAAAGNDARPQPEFPASIGDDIVSVGATTPDGLLAAFSNRGALVGAPGVGILSTTSAGRYQRYDGTSMASAHVAGLAALLWAALPDATLPQVRKAIVESAHVISGVEAGRVDAAAAIEALGRESSPSRGAIELSHPSLSFTARRGRIPRAQTVSLRVVGGGARRWWAQASSDWISLPVTSGTTPARVTVRVDPAGLPGSNGKATVVFRDEAGQFVTLSVSLRIGGGPPVSIHGDGCDLRDDGRLHVRAGAGCELRAAEGESNGVQWRLPGGETVNGARLFGHFARKGEYQVLVSRDEGEVDPLAVVIE
ncbi:MAG TPA: S8 family serine peptidase [Myxococcales bacterium]|nr:S8 family serine peptidase [Myxococcales bacterium]